MSMLDKTLNDAKSALTNMGRAALHAMEPNNFEYYMCSIELIDSFGATKGFMSFAVMPNNIMESKTQITTITKTNKGISTLFNNTFVPRDISIQGTFGRKLRLLIGLKDIEGVNTIPFFNSNSGFDMMGGDVLIKTGYGLTKMLQRIVEASTKLDSDGKPFILIFSNYALNTSYVVEVMQDSYSQSTENNMLWFYALEMKAVAPASAVKTQGQKNSKFLTNVAATSIAKTIGGILKSL